jgi:MscS family membrane protein
LSCHQKEQMRSLIVAVLFAIPLGAQTPSAETKDPLGRGTPQSTVLQFLEACHAREYSKALRYLDLRKMPPDRRLKEGPELARQLEDLLDDTPFDVTTLSREPEGDQSDGLTASLEHLASFQVDSHNLDLQLERVELRPGLHVWVVSAESVALIPTAHKAISETPFEKRLPQRLVTSEIYDTPVWRWIALLLMGAVIWILCGVFVRGILAAVRPLLSAPELLAPLRICLAVSLFRFAMELAPPSALPRLVVERGMGLTFALALAWTGAVVVDFVAARWHSRLDPRVQVMSYSVLPLGRQILKLSFFVLAILSVLSLWGYNTTTILAGLGVGGLAVALAAQKTIENLFGGISVIGDRPVLVGDACRFGDHSGTVMHIGLRSTRIRTDERTVISVPNAQFSSIALENVSRRDKIWFHPKLNLRRDTTSGQILQVVQSITEFLNSHEKVECGDVPVRFIGVGPISLDIDVAVYINTTDYNEFLRIQQDLLLQILLAVESAGTALAVPLQETVEKGSRQS